MSKLTAAGALGALHNKRDHDAAEQRRGGNMSRREDRARYLAAKDGKRWSDMQAEVADAAKGRLEDLEILVGTAEGKGEGWADPDRLKALGVEEFDATEDDGVAAEEARERIEEYPLCVEGTMTFEIVLASGGPDERLLIECAVIESMAPEFGNRCFEIRRVLYRYSWTGSAEVELHGDDRETAEAFARRVVPELAE